MCKWVRLTIEIAINEITIAKCAMPHPAERLWIAMLSGHNSWQINIMLVMQEWLYCTVITQSWFSNRRATAAVYMLTMWRYVRTATWTQPDCSFYINNGDVTQTAAVRAAAVCLGHKWGVFLARLEGWLIVGVKNWCNEWTGTHALGYALLVCVSFVHS